MKIHISDHAMLRYVQRAMGFDVEELRERMSSEAEAAAKMGASTVTIGGMVFCLREHAGGVVTVTTVLTEQMKAKRFRPHRRLRAEA